MQCLVVMSFCDGELLMLCGGFMHDCKSCRGFVVWPLFLMRVVRICASCSHVLCEGGANGRCSVAIFVVAIRRRIKPLLLCSVGGATARFCYAVVVLW